MIIGISGKAGVGKDTFADFLVKSCGFVNVSQSDPMKRFCRDVLGFTDEQLWGPSERRNEPDPRLGGLTPRQALQSLGTEWGRACHEDMWVNYALKVAHTLLTSLEPWLYSPERGLSLGPKRGQPVRGVVIPDVRFPNELRAIRNAGTGKVARLRRDVQSLLGQAGTHASERDQDNVPDSAFDVVIENNGSLQDLRFQALRLTDPIRIDWPKRQ